MRMQAGQSSPERDLGSDHTRTLRLSLSRTRRTPKPDDASTTEDAGDADADADAALRSLDVRDAIFELLKQAGPTYAR